MKHRIGALFVIVIGLCGITLQANVDKKPWTVLVYLAAVNNLNNFAYADLAEMIKIGSNDNVNLLVYLSVLRNDGSKVTLRLYVEKDTLVQIGSPTIEDSGDVQTLKNALAWALTDYPSDSIAVVLWDHGSGALNRSARCLLRGICYDDISGNYLTDRDCLDAFSWAQHTYLNGKKFDVIACDACLMAMVEFAFTLSSCTNYFVASQENIPGDGFDYARVFDDFEQGIPTPLSFTQNLVSAYQEEYVGTPDYTLSAVNTTKLISFVESLNQLAQFLTNLLKGSKASTVRSYLTKSYNRALKFNGGLYMDLKGFLASFRGYVSKLGLTITEQERLTALIKTNESLLNQCVIKKVSSTSYTGAGGLSWYFYPYSLDSSYANLYWTEKNPIMLQLLKSYIQ